MTVGAERVAVIGQRRLLDRRLTQVRGWMTRLPVAVGLGTLAVFGLLAAAHPLLINVIWRGHRRVYDPVVGHDMTIAHPAGPSLAHPLGTDTLGRDVLSMLTYASGQTLSLAVATAVITGVAALALGSSAAYWQGRIDLALSQISDALVLLPAPITMIAVGIARPGALSPIWFGLGYGLLAGLGAAAVVVRSYGLTVMAKPFIDAARVAGGGPWHIISRHLVPHLLPLTAVQTMLAVTGAVIVAGFVEFMTPGASDRVGFGTLIYSGLAYQEIVFTRRTAWWALASGGLSISAICSAFYLLSVGSRRTVAPSQHRTSGR